MVYQALMVTISLHLAGNTLRCASNEGQPCRKRAHFKSQRKELFFIVKQAIVYQRLVKPPTSNHSWSIYLLNIKPYNHQTIKIKSFYSLIASVKGRAEQSCLGLNYRCAWINQLKKSAFAE